MIRLNAAQTRLVEAHLADPIVDARLELVARHGTRVLGRYAPTAGTIRWDASARRGLLDVDLHETAPALTPTHPLAALGQTIEAWWTWPRIGVSVPCGHWLITDPVRLTEALWRVAADPVGPARLDRAAWWRPEPRILTGPMSRQAGAVLAELGMSWEPDEALHDGPVPDTHAEPGTALLATLETILAETGTPLRPHRRTLGVILGEARQSSWEWSDVNTFRITAAPQFVEVPNRVTVFFEEEAKDGDGKVLKGWSEPLTTGPRRWGGPYGQVPHVERIDKPTTLSDLKRRARAILLQRQGEASTVTVEMRADPRVEVGDLAHIRSARDATDCRARVASVILDAATGHASIECAALTGTIAGVPVGLLDNTTI